MKRSRILVVDDHSALLAGVRFILETEGYTVLTATDGKQALQVMEKEACPDLIVSDIMMPRMDGYAFLEAVRTRPEWARIPFLFLTARKDSEEVLQEKNLKVEGFITKPFAPQDLVSTVRTWL